MDLTTNPDVTKNLSIFHVVRTTFQNRTIICESECDSCLQLDLPTPRPNLLV